MSDFDIRGLQPNPQIMLSTEISEHASHEQACNCGMPAQNTSYLAFSHLLSPHLRPLCFFAHRFLKPLAFAGVGGSETGSPFSSPGCLASKSSSLETFASPHLACCARGKRTLSCNNTHYSAHTFNQRIFGSCRIVFPSRISPGSSDLLHQCSGSSIDH